jgi:Mlc titration factor MtfA (ptsG expression regulator)
MQREFHRLQHDAAHRRPSLFDHYGAGSPEEFFAVVTECFFENPQPFKARHPELYAALSGFFHQDPAGWPGWHVKAI